MHKGRETPDWLREEDVQRRASAVHVPPPKPSRMAHLALSPCPPMPVQVKGDNGQTLGLFFGYQFFFSNFHSCRFELEGTTWTCTEHYYVYEKLLHFGKADVARALAKLADYSVREERERLHVPSTPAQMKAIGRVTEERATEERRAEWTRAKVDVMKRCVRAKFEQNSHLGNALLATGDMELVEASSGDKFWGNGLPLQHPAKHADVAKWRLDGGKNMLGNVLMWVRGELKKQRAATSPRREPIRSRVENAITPSPVSSSRRTASPISVEEPQKPAETDHRYGSVMQRLSSGAIFPQFQSSKRSFRTSAGPLGPQLPKTPAPDSPAKRIFTVLDEEDEWVDVREKHQEGGNCNRQTAWNLTELDKQLPQAVAGKPRPAGKMPAQVWDSDTDDGDEQWANSGAKPIVGSKQERLSLSRPAYGFRPSGGKCGTLPTKMDSDDEEEEFEAMVARFSAESRPKRQARLEGRRDE